MEILFVGLALIGFAVWAMTHSSRGEKPNSADKRHDESRTARETTGIYSESTNHHAQPGDHTH